MGDEAVAGLTEEAGGKGESFAEGVPWVVEELQGLSYSVGTMVDVFAGSEGLSNEDDTVRDGVEVETGEDLAGELAFEGNEAEFVTLVTLEQEADDVIAQSAEAVEEQDGASFDLCALGGGHLVADEFCMCEFSAAGTFILDGCL